ncbi:SxtJ family membrane protein [Aliiroseovarius sp. F20344]|uniref:SxtJ family membrane protein n=1 Tax=Aliiroseovarius sp. F20344 TaxID=2926414 RepID=UPI001FF40A3B|nr:SxtJ family membrane protein [Aliiroseovarius sp. F20344]MCK0141885.1 SxtJ family membrane protein [Aliiroseovarius sp. F20344]
MSEHISKTEVTMGSDKNFGLVFGSVAALIALYMLIRGGAYWPIPALFALVFFALAFIRPAILNPLNRLWFRFGLLLHSIISPLVMFLVFLIAFVPIALIFRLKGTDPLSRDFDKSAKSYWKPRTSKPESMLRQY